MGTPVAPTLANLFMGKVEATALNSWQGTPPLLWLRYIDDIFLLLEDTPNVLLDLVEHLNKQVASIKFTVEHSNESINFLDVTLFKGPRFRHTGQLDVQPYSKAIDPHAYLHYSSAHHKSIMVGTVRGEIIRMLRRSSSPEIFAAGIADLEKWFLARGYPRKLLKEQTASVKFSEREAQLRHRENKTLPEMTTVLSVRNHPAVSSSDIYNTLHDDNLPFRPMVTRRRPPCTSDLIIRALSLWHPWAYSGVVILEGPLRPSRPLENDCH